MNEQCCFESSFKNAEPREDTFCGCHEDYDFNWNDADPVIMETVPEEVKQNDDCDCLKEPLSNTQTEIPMESKKKSDEYDIVDI